MFRQSHPVFSNRFFKRDEQFSFDSFLCLRPNGSKSFNSRFMGLDGDLIQLILPYKRQGFNGNWCWKWKWKSTFQSLWKLRCSNSYEEIDLCLSSVFSENSVYWVEERRLSFMEVIGFMERLGCLRFWKRILLGA